MENRNYKVPAANFKEESDGYELKIALPGIAKDEVELNIEEKTLTLKTATKYTPPAGFKCVASEFERCDWAMSLDLPDMADLSSLSAKMENGVLCVSIKKRPETQPRKIEVL